MTEKQILLQINRAAARRRDLYHELADTAWLLSSQREALVNEVQGLDTSIGQLYVTLRSVRAEGVKAGVQKKRERSEVIGRLRQGKLRAPSSLAATQPVPWSTRRMSPARARHERLMRLRKGAAA